MAEAASEHRGRCLCGALRFRATGAPLFIVLCHCESCRRATGGALVAACGFPRERVAIEGEVRYFASSPGVRRGFCPVCGASLTFESERWPGDVHLMASLFDEPENLAPTCHVF